MGIKPDMPFNLGSALNSLSLNLEALAQTSGKQTQSSIEQLVQQIYDLNNQILQRYVTNPKSITKTIYAMASGDNFDVDSGESLETQLTSKIVYFMQLLKDLTKELELLVEIIKTQSLDKEKLALTTAIRYYTGSIIPRINFNRTITSYLYNKKNKKTNPITIYWHYQNQPFVDTPQTTFGDFNTTSSAIESIVKNATATASKLAESSMRSTLQDYFKKEQGLLAAARDSIKSEDQYNQLQADILAIINTNIISKLNNNIQRGLRGILLEANNALYALQDLKNALSSK